jgi:hypothetical protein
MSSCCTTDPNIKATDCPQCGTSGPIVGARPVWPHRPEATDGAWQYCATQDCPVIYYLGADVLNVDELRSQVANKALNKPTPVCFCFSHTSEDLAADLVANDGVSTIKADIKMAVAEGFCACEHLNPSQKCCLADVHRTIKSITTQAAGMIPASGTN